MAQYCKIFFLYLIAIIWFGLSVLDIYTSLMDYWNFETKLAVQLQSPIGSFIPTVTFCGPKAQFVTDKYYEEKFGHPVDRPIGVDESNTINDFLTEMSASKQFEVLFSAIDLRNLIDWNANWGYVNERGHFVQEIPILVQLNKDLFCFTMEHHPDLTYQENGTKEINPALSYNLKLKLPELMAIVHTTGQHLFNIKEFRYQTIMLKPLKTTNLNYEMTTVKKLPPPFDTNCKLYETQSFLGSYYRIHKDFLIRALLKQFNCIPRHYFIQKGQTLDVCPIDVDLALKDDYLPTDCYQEQFILTQDKGFDFLAEVNSTDSHRVDVYPAILNRNLVYLPQVTFYELLEDVVENVFGWLALLFIYLLISVRLQSTLNKKDNDSEF